MRKYLLLLFLISSLSFAQTQIGNDIDGSTATDEFGGSVCLSANGNVMAVGARLNDSNGINSGHVRVYRNESDIWTQIGFDIVGEASGDELGQSISLSADGTILAIGAYRNDNANGTNSGHVRVYRNESDIWTQIGNAIEGEAAEDSAGISVSLSADGSIVAIGASGNDTNGTNSGHVRIYRNESDTWTQIGASILGETTNDLSGWSVSLSANGNIVAIGALGNNGSGSGHVRVYENQSGIWTQVGNNIDGETSTDFSGWSISLSANGGIVAIGAYRNSDNGFSSGHVRVYENQSGIWTQVGSDIDGESTSSESGYSVGISDDGNIVAIGARNNSNFNGALSGHVRIYKNQSGIWTQIGNDIDGEASLDQSGSSVSLSGDGAIVAIGAPFNSNNNGLSGHVRIYNLSALLSTENKTISSFHLSPNPATNEFTIQLSNNNTLKNISIYDNLGRLVNNTKKANVDTSSMKTGVYIVRIETENGKACKKLIIE